MKKVIVLAVVGSSFAVPSLPRESAAQTVCVFDVQSNPVRHSIVEFWDAGGYQKHSTGTSHCVDQAGVTSIEELPGAANTLLTAYPNPALSTTTVQLSVDRPISGTLNVYDALGRRVLTGPYQQLPAGTHKSTLDLDNLSAGLYLTRFEGVDGSTINGSFIDLQGSVMRAGVIEPLQTVRDYQPERSAHKVSGADSVRVTSQGKRQQTLIVNPGLGSVDVVMQPGHTVLMYVREMTNHYQQLGGDVLITEGRSGLEQRVQVTGDVTRIVVPSDSVLWQYVDQDHQSGRFSIQPLAPVGSPLKTSTDVYTHPAAFVTPLYTADVPLGPWFMSSERYAKDESVATLFAMKDSFDLERYWDEIKSGAVIPPRSAGNYVIAYNYDEYKGGLSEDQLRAGVRELPYRILGEGDGWAIADSVRNAMSLMVPTGYDKTFLTIQPVESDLDIEFVIKISINLDFWPPGVYWNYLRFSDAAHSEMSLIYSSTMALDLYDYALVFSAMESSFDDGNLLPYYSRFIKMDAGFKYVNEFTDELKEWKAVQYGLGQMVRSGTWGHEPTAGGYEVHPDEIRGGFMSLDGDTGN